MTRKYITPPDMDIYKDLIPESSEPDPYARYGGLKPGMVVTDTRLPFYPPEPEPSWSTLSQHERIDRAKPTLAVIGGVLLVLGVAGLIVAFQAGWLA